MKSKISLPIIITAVFFSSLVVGLIAWASFRPHHAPEITTSATQEANNAWLTQKAKESGGSFDRLALLDQQKAQELTKGKGAFVISMIYSHSK